MKKLIVRILGVFVFCCIVFMLLNKLFVSKHYYINTTEEFKSFTKQKELDIVFYGSSHTFQTFNPLIIDQECKTNSFNLGSDGLKMRFTDLVLRESLKHTKPKLIVLEVYRGSLTEAKTKKAKGYQLRALDFASNLSWAKLKKVSNNYRLNEIPSVLSPLVRNHSNWYNIDYFNFDRKISVNSKNTYFYRGFVGSTKVIKGKQRERFKKFKSKKIVRNPKKKMISNISKEDIIGFIDIAKKNGIEVLLVSSPDLRARYNNYVFFDELDQICKDQDVHFLNLNDFYKEIKLNLNDFRDPGHLNVVGTSKTTRFLAKYINKNYSFKDRSNEEGWKEKSNEVKKMKRYINLVNKNKYF